MAVSLAVSEVFSVKYWRHLAIGVRGRSESLKVTSFDKPYTIYYWSAVVSITLSCTMFELFDVK